MDIPDIIREKAGDLTEAQLQTYVQKVFKLLEQMKPDDVLIIAKLTKSESRDIFIETVKYYMRQNDWQAGLMFAKGFTELRKHDLDFIKNNSKKNVTL
jgi:hypothetical protein